MNASGGEFYGTMDEAVDLFKQALVKYESLLLKISEKFLFLNNIRHNWTK